MADIKLLCEIVLKDPTLQPVKGVTHCNQAVARVAAAMGCADLNGLMADEQYQVMARNSNGNWKKVSGSDAAIHALGNGLAVAGLPSQTLDEAHGHVAVLYPIGMQLSASLGHDVPMVANIGKTVGVMRSSQAFPVDKGEAEYFIWG